MQTPGASSTQSFVRSETQSRGLRAYSCVDLRCDGTYIYWASQPQGAIWRMTLAGAGASVLFQLSTDKYISSLDVDGAAGEIFFRADYYGYLGDIQKIDLDGTNHTIVAVSLQQLSRVRRDEGAARRVWIRTYAGAFYLYDEAAGAIQQTHWQAPSTYPFALDEANSYIFYSGQTATGQPVQLLRCARTGGSVTAIDTSPGTVSYIAHNSGVVYYVDSSGPSIKKANNNGTGQSTVLTSGEAVIRGIDIDSVNSKIVFAEGPTSLSMGVKISRCDLDGGNYEVINQSLSL